MADHSLGSGDATAMQIIAFELLLIFLNYRTFCYKIIDCQLTRCSVYFVYTIPVPQEVWARGAVPRLSVRKYSTDCKLLRYRHLSKYMPNRSCNRI